MPLMPKTVRLDLKCGKGSISEGQKCHKGVASKAENKKVEPTFGQRLQAGWSAFNALNSAVTAGQNIGQAVKHRSLGHAVGALGNIGGAALSLKASSEYSKGRGTSGNLYAIGSIGSNIAGTVAGNAIGEADFRKRQANATANKSNYTGNDPYQDLGLSKNASASEIKAAYIKRVKTQHPDNGGNAGDFLKTKQAYEEILRRTKRGKASRDSIWADGFDI